MRAGSRRSGSATLPRRMRRAPIPEITAHTADRHALYQEAVQAFDAALGLRLHRGFLQRHLSVLGEHDLRFPAIRRAAAIAVERARRFDHLPSLSLVFVTWRANNPSRSAACK